MPLRLFSAKELDAKTFCIPNPSKQVFEAVNTHSVCEAAALLAAGEDSSLIIFKQKQDGITCAVAKSPQIINPLNVGRRCGSLSIVGIGPGSDVWRTPEATNAIITATDVIGYKYYLNLLGSLSENKKLHKYDLGEENKRAAKALRLASEGKDVALISSGDPGIYAMASLVFELIDRGEFGRVVPQWRRVEVQVIPGISALQAAASRVGAPLGHDFCAISLSDLLTPWVTIEMRLKAAATGDFVIALYNPISKKRRRQFDKACKILLEIKSSETPVVLSKNVGRDGEKIQIINLSELKSNLVDMLTVVIIGNNSTQRIINSSRISSVYTPRGYLSTEEQDR